MAGEPQLTGMSAGLVVELAVSNPGDCPVAVASADTGAAVSGVDRAQAVDERGYVAEEFSLPSSVTPDEGTFTAVAAMGDRDVYRFERDRVDPCVCEAVEAIAGPVSDVSARDGTLSVTVRTQSDETVRTVVADLTSRFEGVRLVRMNRAGGGEASDLAVVDRARLTDRQREVLETAHEMGYFAYPKGANAGEVADAVDCSLSTFSEHLAAAQSKLLDAILEG